MDIGMTREGYDFFVKRKQGNLLVQAGWLKISPLRFVKISNRTNPGLKMILNHLLKFKGSHKLAFDFLKKLPLDSILF